MKTPPPSPRSEVRRKANRGHYDRAQIHAIIDAAFLCHIAFNDAGSTHCLPTACWRDDDFLYIHGANNSRLTHALLTGECAVCISHLDGLVLARSAFHHSMNYRSVVIYGRFGAVDEVAAKAAAMHAFLEHVSPGRNRHVRPANAAELAGTRILRLPLNEAAAKIRNWGVEDSPEDMAIPVWAGVIPLSLRPGQPEPEAGCADHPLPELANALRLKDSP
ncbi:MAG: pyridoxamine 5'-phosphate oxidase family protein [Rhodocyclales bacterium GT-UBC]|nr:MAG: pyridoxamine 5'-phosphate oxidase family protein [Rhodocyclales bacterium GT-UBC]